MRFVTDSDYIVIKAKAKDYPIPTASPILSCGFDLYINNGFRDVFFIRSGAAEAARARP